MDKHQKDKPALSVEINGKHVCTAGICGKGVLTASMDIQNDRNNITFTNFYIMGLYDGDYYWWSVNRYRINIGDEIVFKIIKADCIDEPYINLSDLKYCEIFEGIKLPPRWMPLFWSMSKANRLLNKINNEHLATLNRSNAVNSQCIPALRYEKNDKYICTCGINEIDSSLSANLRIANHIINDGEKMDEVSLYLGGLVENNSYSWHYDDGLQIGDKILIKVLRTNDVDEPEIVDLLEKYPDLKKDFSDLLKKDGA